MSQFEGQPFSTISDKMPSRLWDRTKFILDWQSQIREKNKNYKEHEIKVAVDTIISGFYDTYETLFSMIDDCELSGYVKSELKAKINLAMINLLEYGQRRSTDIVLTLKDRKLAGQEQGAELFNGIIDNLIYEVDKADKEFHLALTEGKDK